MPRMLINCLWIAGAGAGGALARYAIGYMLNKPAAPLGTLLVNISGAFLLGWLYAAVAPLGQREETLRLAIGVGFIGTYTTFSTMMFEADDMLLKDHWLRCAGYLGISVFLGMIAVRLGAMAGGK
jgi:CrcB protein